MKNLKLIRRSLLYSIVQGYLPIFLLKNKNDFNWDVFLQQHEPDTAPFAELRTLGKALIEELPEIIDLVVEGAGNRIAIECDGDRWHPIEKLPENLARQAVLERLGWKFIRIRGSEFYRDPDGTMREAMSTTFLKLSGPIITLFVEKSDCIVILLVFRSSIIVSFLPDNFSQPAEGMDLCSWLPDRIYCIPLVERALNFPQNIFSFFVEAQEKTLFSTWAYFF